MSSGDMVRKISAFLERNAHSLGVSRWDCWVTDEACEDGMSLRGCCVHIVFLTDRTCPMSRDRISSHISDCVFQRVFRMGLVEMFRIGSVSVTPCESASEMASMRLGDRF